MKRPAANTARVRKDVESNLILASTRIDPANEARLSELLDPQLLEDGAGRLSTYMDDMLSLISDIETSGGASALPDLDIDLSGIEPAADMPGPMSDATSGGEGAATDGDLPAGDLIIGSEGPAEAMPEDMSGDLEIARVVLDDLSFDVPVRDAAPDDIGVAAAGTDAPGLAQDLLSALPGSDLGTRDDDLQDSLADKAQDEGIVQVATADGAVLAGIEDLDGVEMIQVTEDEASMNAQISAHLREASGMDQIDADDMAEDEDDLLDLLSEDPPLGDEDDHGLPDVDPGEIADFSGEVEFADLEAAEMAGSSGEGGSGARLPAAAKEVGGSLVDLLGGPASLPEPKPTGFDENDWMSAHLDDLVRDQDDTALVAARPVVTGPRPIEAILGDDDFLDPVDALEEQDLLQAANPTHSKPRSEQVRPDPGAAVDPTPGFAKYGDFDEDPLSIMDDEEDDVMAQTSGSGRITGERTPAKNDRPAKAPDGDPNMGFFGKKTATDGPGTDPDVLRADTAADDPDLDGAELIGETAEDVAGAPADAMSGAASRKPRGPLMTLLLGSAVVAVIGISAFSVFGDRLAPGPVLEPASGKVASVVTPATPVVPGDPAIKPAPVQPMTATEPKPELKPGELPGDLAGDPAAKPGVAAEPAIPAAGDVAAPLPEPSDEMRNLDDFAKGLEAAKNGDLSDLFDKEKVVAPAVAGLTVTQEMLDGFTPRKETEEVRKAIDLLFEQIKGLEKQGGEKDARIAALEQTLSAAQSQAQKAEALALAQNEVLVEFVRVQEKVEMAEKLVVDLSKRIARVETTDPADRVAVERSLDDLNGRIEGMARDIGLIARITINGSPASFAGAAPAPGGEPSVPGAAAVYEEAPSSARPASGVKAQVPADVKTGDFVEGYGYVLDIIPTSDGSRLVVMENGSVLLS